jgi:hypothetical protein
VYVCFISFFIFLVKKWGGIAPPPQSKSRRGCAWFSQLKLPTVDGSALFAIFGKMVFALLTAFANVVATTQARAEGVGDVFAAVLVGFDRFVTSQPTTEVL